MLAFNTMLELLKNERQECLINHISKAQPFVFLDFEKTELSRQGEDGELDLPFKVCSFEVSKKASTLTDKNTGEVILKNVYCVVAEEQSPGEIVYYALSTVKDDNVTPILSWYHQKDYPDTWNLLDGMVKQFLRALKLNSHGHTSPRTVFKWKENGTKKQLRINKVIYVGNRESKEAVTIGHNIQWSHAFWVMGHWRDISGIGKDREGNYGVSGRTWVIPHVKKAELGDPITKIRVSKET